jgi:membrane-associated phospholipid phosphatase
VSESKTLLSPSRRRFLGKAGAVTAAIAGGAVGVQPLLDSTVQAQSPEVFRGTRTLDDERSLKHKNGTPENNDGALTRRQRADRAFEIRAEVARREWKTPIPKHADNGDEDRYENKIGSFTKGLRHNAIGGVDASAYAALVAAIRSGRFSDFESLRPFMGCPDPARQRPFVNPESANAYDLEGTDPGQLTIPPAPAFAGAEEAGEMVELYWMSLLRDVSFDDYAQNPLAQEAADDLSQLSDFRGPKQRGRVTTQTLFRDNFPGCTTGPYISQFMLRQTAFGAQRVDQRIEARAPGVDYMTGFQDWLDIQNGCAPDSLLIPPDAQTPLRFIRNGRDISQYVRLDVLYQAYFVAALILINGITLNETTSPFVFKFPFDEGNPYGPDGSTFVQAAFGTFGNPCIMTLATEPATRALKAVWHQKWRVHRRLRPEAFGGRVEVVRRNLAQYPIHADLTDRSTVLSKILNRFGSHLLPQAFPEGSPLHPSYGSGHSTVAGACVTMLKAFFDETTVIQEPVRINPADGGQTTVLYEGPPLTVGGELNKLASNIATGRNISGVHWRTDGVEAIKLGEAVAISMLRDMRETYSEPFEGFSLTKFDGTTITV